MNWNRLLIRGAVSFILLFLLGYITPGFSGFTFLHLLLISAVLAVVVSGVERMVKPENAWQRSVILFITAIAVIYAYSMIILNARPPVISALLAGVGMGAFDLLYPEKLETDQS